MKRLRPLLLAGGLALAVSPASAQITLLHDTFADGSRTVTSLPNQSAVYASAPESVTMGTGSLAYTQSGSSQRLLTYFAPDGIPVSLDVGDKLVATIVFTPRVALYATTSKNFRFGLFTDPTNGQLSADGFNDAGGSGNPFADATGYAVQLALSNTAATSAIPTIGKRVGGSSSLLGSNSAYVNTSGGDKVVVGLDVAYTLQLSLERLAAAQMLVSFTISDSGGTISSLSVLDDPGGAQALGTASIHTDYDALAFRFSSATGTADELDFSEFKIEYFSSLAVIPEPAALPLLGALGALGLLATRRRR